MAGRGEDAGLGKTPEALAKRQAVATLGDGKTIIVFKWSSQKYAELLPHCANLADVPLIAEQSVAEADRERVRGMEFDDLMEISNTAIELNVTEATLKNFKRFLTNSARVVKAVPTSAQPSLS